MSVHDRSFDEFAAAHVRELMRTAYLISCNETDAEDLVQECFWRLARRWRKVSAMEYPAAYARQIIVNLAIDRSRSQAKTRPLSAFAPTDDREGDLFEQADDDAERAYDAVASRAELVSALQVLSGQQRAAIVLRYFNDLSEAETARVLGCGVGTVKSTTARGLARMRELLNPTAEPGAHQNANQER